MVGTGVGTVWSLSLLTLARMRLPCPNHVKPLPFCERISLCGTLSEPVASATILKRPVCKAEARTLERLIGANTPSAALR